MTALLIGLLVAVIWIWWSLEIITKDGVRKKSYRFTLEKRHGHHLRR